MRPSQHLDRLHRRTVTGDLAVVVPVGSDQIGLGITAVGLGPGAAMPAPVVADDLGLTAYTW
jgi:hypothetical protein